MKRRHGWRRWHRVSAIGALLGIALSAAGTGYDYAPARPVDTAEPPTRQGRRLLSRLRARVPSGTYVVIDQTHNRLRLMRGATVLLEAPCSAGSGMVLRENGEGRRVWVFDTPRGVFHVRTKLVNPVWRKPDWAFIEEGRPVPADPAERFEYGVLGEYGLSFGDGYLIHGTLYERLIGRPASHGCIRVGRKALRELYRWLPVGARIYIY